MNATDEIIDMVTQTSYSITEARNMINAAIAAAVAAEREACETLAVEHGAPVLADAIRARNGRE